MNPRTDIKNQKERMDKNILSNFNLPIKYKNFDFFNFEYSARDDKILKLFQRKKINNDLWGFWSWKNFFHY